MDQDGNAVAGEDVDALIGRVDELLYRAKDEGRTRVVTE
jgi:PleD family two-component response regulator